MELHGIPKDSGCSLAQCRSPKGILTNEASQSKDYSIVDEHRVERGDTTDPASGMERLQGRTSGVLFT